LVGIVGYLLRNLSTESNAYLFDQLLEECRSPYVENEVVRIPIATSSALGIVVPKDRALYDYVYDEQNSKATIIYGYAIVEGKRLSAKEINGLKENEFVKLLEKVDGSFCIVRIACIQAWISTF